MAYHYFYHFFINFKFLGSIWQSCYNSYSVHLRKVHKFGFYFIFLHCFICLEYESYNPVKCCQFKIEIIVFQISFYFLNLLTIRFH
jgi:hypothetical protein